MDLWSNDDFSSQESICFKLWERYTSGSCSCSYCRESGPWGWSELCLTAVAFEQLQHQLEISGMQQQGNLASFPPMLLANSIGIKLNSHCTEEECRHSRSGCNLCSEEKISKFLAATTSNSQLLETFFRVSRLCVWKLWHLRLLLDGISFRSLNPDLFRGVGAGSHCCITSVHPSRSSFCVVFLQYK